MTGPGNTVAERKCNKGHTPFVGLKQAGEKSVVTGMILHQSLSRSRQLSLNGRAMLRDLAQGDFHKVRFHLRGFCRALIAA